MLVQVRDGHQPRPAGPVGHWAFRVELVGVHAARHHLDRPARDAEPGQVRLLVGASGHHGVDAAADGGLEADALGADANRQHMVPALGDAKGVERLHDRDAQVAGGGEGGEAAGPAQRVHNVRALVAPLLVQRLAECGHLGEQLRLVAGVLVARADELDLDTRLQLGLGRQRGAVLPRVHGDAMALAGKAPAQFAQPGVFGERRRVLRYQGDLHVLASSSGVAITACPRKACGSKK